MASQNQSDNKSAFNQSIQLEAYTSSNNSNVPNYFLCSNPTDYSQFINESVGNSYIGPIRASHHVIDDFDDDERHEEVPYIKSDSKHQPLFLDEKQSPRYLTQNQISGDQLKTTNNDLSFQLDEFLAQLSPECGNENNNNQNQNQQCYEQQINELGQMSHHYSIKPAAQPGFLQIDEFITFTGNQSPSFMDKPQMHQPSYSSNLYGNINFNIPSLDFTDDPFFQDKSKKQNDHKSKNAMFIEDSIKLYNNQCSIDLDLQKLEDQGFNFNTRPDDDNLEGFCFATLLHQKSFIQNNELIQQHYQQHQQQPQSLGDIEDRGKQEDDKFIQEISIFNQEVPFIHTLHNNLSNTNIPNSISNRNNSTNNKNNIIANTINNNRNKENVQNKNQQIDQISQSSLTYKKVKQNIELQDQKTNQNVMEEDIEQGQLINELYHYDVSSNIDHDRCLAQESTDDAQSVQNLISDNCNNINTDIQNQKGEIKVKGKKRQNKMEDEKNQESEQLGEKKKYRQSKHKNVFKNFGQALFKFILGNQEFKKMIEHKMMTAPKIKKFNDWIRNDIKLERKLDFAKGLTREATDSEEKQTFRILLKELALKFFTEYAQQYIENSKKLENHDIHIRSIPTFIEGVKNPDALARFKPCQ